MGTWVQIEKTLIFQHFFKRVPKMCTQNHEKCTQIVGTFLLYIFTYKMTK